MTDYPAIPAEKKWQGAVRISLGVDERGHVTRCTVISTSGYAALDDTTCPLLLDRARFHPATDSAGKPVAGIFFSVITWAMPGLGTPPDSRQPLPLPYETIMYSYIVEPPDGTLGHCLLRDQSAPCDALYNPHASYHDASGKPLRKRVSLRYIVTVEDVPDGSEDEPSYITRQGHRKP